MNYIIHIQATRDQKGLDRWIKKTPEFIVIPNEFNNIPVSDQINLLIHLLLATLTDIFIELKKY